MWAALVDLGRTSIGEAELRERVTRLSRAGELGRSAVLTATMSNLDGFVMHKLPLPEPLATSAEIQDRQSTFLAYVFRASTPEQARRAHSHVRNVIHAKRPASHEIMAWRCMVLKEGRTGLRGDDDFKIEEGCEDDGEERAGGHILRVMRSEAVMDAVVIVSRW
jgi:putative IMPACT (imprinted ancient) family translation regulator